MALAGVCLYIPDSVELSQTASNLGASLASSISTAVEVVVASTVLGDWPVACCNLGHTPVCVTHAWLHACSSTHSKVPVQRFKLPALQGLKLCFTGIGDAAQRATFSHQVESAGGQFSADLVRDCTHLVARQAAGPKFKYAELWGQAIVSIAWLDASCRLGLRQPESRFAVKGSSNKDHSVGTAPSAAASRRTNSVSSHDCQHKVAAAAADADSRKAVDNDASAANKTAQDHAGLSTDCDDGLFLDWVRFHPMGMTKEQAVQVSRLAACGGAVREITLNPRVTHIIVGSVVSVADMAAVRQHALAWREQVRIVKLGWLEHCAAHRHCQEPVDTHLQVQLSAAPNAATTITNNHSMLRTTSYTEAGVTNLARANSSVAPVLVPTLLGPSTASIDFGDLQGLETHTGLAGSDSLLAGPSASAAGVVGNVPSAFIEQPLPKTRGEALKSLWFTLAAVSQDKELGALVRTNGGQVFTAESVRKVRDGRHAFALCPASLGPGICQELEKGAADFRCVPASQRVTGWWLQECLHKCKLLNPARHDVPAFRPLPFDIPLQALHNIRFHVAGYTAASALLKKSMLHVLKTMGGVVTGEMTPYNTHLVTPESGGAKWDLACRSGMIIVNEHWVLHVARTGRLPDPWEARFRPNNESSQLRSLLRAQYQLRQALPHDMTPAHLASQQLPGQLGDMLPAQADGPSILGATQLPTQVAGQAGGTAGVVGKSMSYSAAGGFRLTASDAAPSKPLAGPQDHSGSAAAGEAAAITCGGTKGPHSDVCRAALQPVPHNVLCSGTGRMHDSQEGPTTGDALPCTRGNEQPSGQETSKEQKQGHTSGCGTASVSHQQIEQQQSGAEQVLMGSAGEEDALMGIEALMATHQGGMKQPGPCSQAQDGLMLGKAPTSGAAVATCMPGLGPSEASRDSGGHSSLLNCSGQAGQDTSSKPTVLPQRTSKRQQALLQQDAQRRKPRTRKGGEPMLMESSQQVGYEVGQRPDERLLRKRTGGLDQRSAQEDAKHAAAKQQLMQAMSVKRELRGLS